MNEELQECEKLIQSYIVRNSEEDGFVAYENVQAALTGVSIVLGKAQDNIQNQDYVQAVKLCLTVLHAMILLLESADDSAGYVGDAITDALELIGTIAQAEVSLNSMQNASLFELLTDESTNVIYDGWSEWSLTLLKVCVSLTDTLDKRVVLEGYFQKLLEQNQDNTWVADRLNEQIKNLLYQLILKHEGEGQAAEFNSSNLTIASFRERAIKAEMDKGNYKQAEQLALEGEEQDHEWNTLVFKWKQLRYEAYKRSNQLEQQQKLAVEFVLNNHFNYYAELKLTYASADWSEMYPHLIQTLEQQQNTFQKVYTQILVEEKEWAKLLEYVKQSPSRVELFYTYLIKTFPGEVFDLFKQHIEQMASQASSRKDYKAVCKVIRLFKKAGKDAPVQEIVRKLLELYPKKLAFQDELSQI
ncbi:hypothetical protein EHS13_02455 [Paenibacillus psychroresistens]|uniref:Uncharacterized protein n=1 Tax=Paenibacillus psychroresistens TaxID=1778678 RepID=A0A6B8REQ8_9BACL|nr:hypothetical protein [Paenibacillus psychroresistens]QGQ93846.1 hypothetical protein EHS13_02455 [Paenibacillus psychroresistens]